MRLRMPWKTNVTVAALVEENDRFLIVEEHTPEGVRFNQPAGHLEPGETLIDAVIRETLEETGREFAPLSLSEISLWHHSPEQSFFRVCFVGTVSAPLPNAKIDKDIIRQHWFSEKQLESMSQQLRSPLVLKAIKTFRKGQRFPLDLLHTTDFSLKS